MGVVASRLQDLDQWLDWDGQNMKFTNIPATAKIRSIIENRFKITDGNPTFDRKYSDPVDAYEFAASLVIPNYLDVLKLPDMP